VTMSLAIDLLDISRRSRDAPLLRSRKVDFALVRTRYVRLTAKSSADPLCPLNC
jgi:hypothetical protein